MMENFKNLCDRLKINYKKQLLTTTLISIVLLVLAILFCFIYSVIVGVLLLFVLVGNLLFTFLSLKSKEKQLINAKEIAFNGFYRYVVTLLKNGDILYSALQSSLQYVDEVLYDDINELITDIENDTSLEPFLKFSESFDDETIKQMIILLYKAQDVGSIDEVLNSINECMVNLQDNSIKSYIEKDKKTIEKYFIFPLVFSAAIILIVSMYVFSLIGGNINV